MFEENTFDVVLDRMLGRVPDSMDKREGAIIYDALAPAAVELQLAYISLDTFLGQVLRIRQEGNTWSGKRGNGMCSPMRRIRLYGRGGLNRHRWRLNREAVLIPGMGRSILWCREKRGTEITCCPAKRRGLWEMAVRGSLYRSIT